MPATDVDFEREFEELVRDLRALPTAAPEQVREHVRLLGEPARARTLRDVLPALSLRRSLLVLAPVCVLGLVSAALIHGLVNSGGSQNQPLERSSPLGPLDHRKLNPRLSIAAPYLGPDSRGKKKAVTAR